MKVLFLANIPSPYRVDFFNEFGRLCDLTVTFEGQKSTERNKKWVSEGEKNYKQIILKGWRTKADQFFCPGILKIINKTWDFIIIGSYSSPTSMLAIEYMKFHKIPFLIQADGGIIKQENKLKYLLKSHYISCAKAWLSSGNATTEYLVYYGAKRERCFNYPFTSLWKKDLERAMRIKKNNKEDLRRRLEMKEKYIVLSVGRFSYEAGYGKGYDLLLKAAEKLPAEIGIYIVGDDPSKEFLKWKEEKKLDHVHYIGFKVKEELLEYYAASDLFILMTRADVWGLVINEAMMFGLPIITTDMCVAGLELVENNKNGYIIPIYQENILSDKIEYILYNERLRGSFGEESLRRIQAYTIENMAKVHMEILNHIDY